MLGPDVEFRDGQREAIEAVIGDGARALVVQRTGWGKSLVYWIATRVRRDTGHGPTLIVFLPKHLIDLEAFIRQSFVEALAVVGK